MTGSIARTAVIALLILCTITTGLSYWMLSDAAAAWIATGTFFCIIGTVALMDVRIKAPPLAPVLLILASSLLFVPVAVLQKIFGDLDIGAIVFHVHNGVTGTPVSDYILPVLSAFLTIFSITNSLIVAGSIVRLRQEIYLAFGALIMLVNPFIFHSVSVAKEYFTPSPLLQKIVDPVVLPMKPNLPDIIMIFLEGTDSRFSDRTEFGSASQFLDVLRSQALSLSAVGQISGTGFSAAGMIASQCGLPPVGPPNLHILAEQDCLGDVLRKFGYGLDFFVGGDKEFGGIRAFYEDHGGFRITGLEELRQLNSLFLESSVVSEIADDELVFAAALQRHSEITSLPQPYAMVVETSGPHGRPSYLSRSCSGTGRAEITNDVGRAVRCTTEHALRFVQTIQERQAMVRPDRLLRIIVLSDHLNHAAYFYSVAADLDGANTVLLLGDPVTAGRAIGRVGSMVDVYPTLLDWLGFARRPVSAGIGRSLLSDPPTLPENIGLTRNDLTSMEDDKTLLRMLAAPYPVAPYAPSQ